MSSSPKENTRKRRSTQQIRKLCSTCMGTEFRRVNRALWVERTVLTWLGFFPWECVLCRNRRYFRDDGHRSRSHSGEAGPAS